MGWVLSFLMLLSRGLLYLFQVTFKPLKPVTKILNPTIDPKPRISGAKLPGPSFHLPRHILHIARLTDAGTATSDLAGM